MMIDETKESFEKALKLLKEAKSTIVEEMALRIRDVELKNLYVSDSDVEEHNAHEACLRVTHGEISQKTFPS